jgi:hypothetical protein
MTTGEFIQPPSTDEPHLNLCSHIWEPIVKCSAVLSVGCELRRVKISEALSRELSWTLGMRDNPWVRLLASSDWPSQPGITFEE